jgi:hypothetical protein
MGSVKKTRTTTGSVQQLGYGDGDGTGGGYGYGYGGA